MSHYRRQTCNPIDGKENEERIDDEFLHSLQRLLSEERSSSSLTRKPLKATEKRAAAVQCIRSPDQEMTF